MTYARSFLVFAVSILPVLVARGEDSYGPFTVDESPWTFETALGNVYTITTSGPTWTVSVEVAAPGGDHLRAGLYWATGADTVVNEDPYTNSSTFTHDPVIGDAYGIFLREHDAGHGSTGIEWVDLVAAEIEEEPEPEAGGVISQAEAFELAAYIWGAGLAFAFLWIGASWIVRHFDTIAGDVSDK